MRTMKTTTKMRPGRRYKALLLGRILAWLVGVVVAAGLAASAALIIAMNWSAFHALVRIGMTLGLGLALFIVVLLLQQGATYLRYRHTVVAITTLLSALCLLSFSFDLLMRPEI